MCLLPYLDRLKHPSLYTDDVTRIVQLQTTTLDRLLFLPFNEHMAPLFQGLSWLTWQTAGEELARAPLAFTLVSYVPFVLSLGLLGWVIRTETGSVPSALASLALFSLSWLSSETVFWYSASSFMWALALTLAAWLAATEVGAGRPLRGALGMALASALSPAFSAIGLLTGPLALLRIVAGDHREGGPRGRRLAPALIAPIAGTLAYLAVCWAFRYGDILSDSLERNLQLRAGLIAAARAPIDFLLPGLFGLHPIGDRISPGVSLSLSALCLLAAVSRAWRSPHRALVLGGLAFILGGYAITFCARCDRDGHFAMLIGQRYHLFPQLGLVMVLAPELRIVLGRWKARPAVGLAAVMVLTALLAGSHAAELKSWGRFFRYPDQANTLAAIDRLGAICGELRISRAQALAALDPIQRRWAAPDSNVLDLLANSVNTRERPATRVRSLLLSALTPTEREAVCGGMDASPYLHPVAARGDLEPAAVGQFASSFRINSVGSGRWIATESPSYLEYNLPATATTGQVRGPIRALGLQVGMPGASMEVWWRGDHDRWSVTKSLRCRLDPSQPGRGWVLPTDRIPHWEPGESRQLRLLFRTPGVAIVDAPRLLR